MVSYTIRLKLFLIIITVLFQSCNFKPDVGEKVEQDMVDFKQSTANIFNPNLRFKRYRLMAKRGNSEAMIELANSFLYEENIRPFNEKKAMHWLVKAAVIGNPHASAELAEIYADGLNDGEGNIRIRSDLETSLMWIFIAKEQNKHLNGKNITLINDDIWDSVKSERTTTRAKERAEKWLTANNT